MKSLFAVLIVGFFSVGAFAEDVNKDAMPAAQSTVLVAETKPAAQNVFISYNYYHFDMDGKNSANTNIYKFGESTVDFHLLTATWLYSSNWTFLTLIPYSKTMVETIYEPTPAGLNFKTKDYTGGLGDARLMAVTPLSVDPAHLTMADISVTLPTGSIDQHFTSAPTQRAAYNMQLGSGTPDLILGTTVTNTSGNLVSSARGQATVRGGRNKNGYALGDEFIAKLTSLYAATTWFTGGVVGNYKIRGAVVGRDDQYELFNSYQSPVDPNIAGDGHQYYHYAQSNWDADLIAKFQTPSYNSVNAAFELGVPVLQGSANKDDVQLNLNYYAAVSLNGSF
jgi:hypothetical protein